MLRLVVVAVSVSLLCACPAEPVVDGGTGGGGGTSDSGFVNYLPDAFESAYGRAIAVHGGLVYVAGHGIRSDAGSNNDFFIARFSTDLVRDTTFGPDGVGLADFDGGVIGVFPANNDRPSALGFDGDRPVLVGNVRSIAVGSGDFGLARFTPQGQLDPAFGTGGLRVESYGGGHTASASALALQPDGKLLVTGNIANGGGRNVDMALVRYEADGRLDRSFTLEDGGAGAVLDFGLGFDEDAVDVFLQPGGAVVAGGGDHFALARLTSSGRLDPTFGPAGTGQFTHRRGTARKVVQRSDGSFWMLGGVELTADGGSGIGQFYLKQVLLSADGVPVPGFGQGGVRTDLVPEYGALRGAALQADGKLLIYFAFVAQGRVLRLNPDGSVDPTFGTNGVLPLDIAIPLFEAGLGTGHHLAIEGNTGWVTDINVVKVNTSTSRQVLALVKFPL